MAYVATSDVDQTVKRARELGAQVYVEPTDIPDIGRFAIMADPQGAVFAAFSSTSEGPPEKEQADVGEVSWHELMTTDYAAAFDFYHDLFGWEKLEAMDMGGGMIYQLFGRNGRQRGGMFNKMPGMEQIPPNWLIYFRVADINGKVEEVKKHGGQILNGPMEVPGGDMIAQCMDPQGAAFAIHSVKNA
jgi:predicted enzyme related to lactoylglutathione lyase